MKKNKKEPKVITISLAEGLFIELVRSAVMSLLCGVFFEIFETSALSAFNFAMIVFPLVFIINVTLLIMSFIIRVHENKNKK